MPHELEVMLRYRRPAYGKTERAFSERWIEPTGAYQDYFGNWLFHVGSNPDVLWSSHTDTVHRTEGIQRVIRTGDILSLGDKSKRTSNCLGADCGAGVWLMLEMIRAEVPGLYVFHAGEEIGGKGSSAIVKNSPGLLDGIKYAIAFDRHGTNSIVTHQIGGRCCSDEFGQSLAKMLGMGHCLDQDGVFTDTALYTDLIPECTNISVGYRGHHTVNETVDLHYLQQLRDALLSRFDASQLEVHRDPAVIEFEDYRTYYSPPDDPTIEPGLKELAAVIRDYPEAAAKLLHDYGCDIYDVFDAIEKPCDNYSRYC